MDAKYAYQYIMKTSNNRAVLTAPKSSGHTQASVANKICI